ncbi:hypothetical protein MARI151_20540 [Maribacter litoralis]|uniref:Uncharacterized protein n=1 Tax=Maribacter litoralis TaxID=2059726 RepID=A0A653QGT7_9FLAO|nr:hypothetical protein MARI151_20540 [Maribacter litoralis]
MLWFCKYIGEWYSIKSYSLYVTNLGCTTRIKKLESFCGIESLEIDVK